MKCARQPKFLENRPVKISCVLEFRLSQRLWRQIQAVAAARGQTFSMVTRFCVLRLAQKCSLEWTRRLERVHCAARAEAASAPWVHRHVMCLYGDDEKLVRVAAMDLGITMTAFARIALALYLGLIAMENRSYRFVPTPKIRALGIRFTEEIQIAAQNTSEFPLFRTLQCHHFSLDSYW